MKSEKTRTIVLFAMFIAIIGILAVTPLGMIPLGFINATTIHIPVIVGAIILGPKFGAALGAVFGLISFLKASFSAMATAFIFSPVIPVPGTGHGSPFSIVIAFVPRILIGVVSYYAYAGMKKLIKNDGVSMGVGAFAGSMTNTILVMGLIYILFGDAYAGAIDLGGKTIEAVILGTVVMNGVPEAIVAVIISVAVCKALKAYMKKGTAKNNFAVQVRKHGALKDYTKKGTEKNDGNKDK